MSSREIINTDNIEQRGAASFLSRSAVSFSLRTGCELVVYVVIRHKNIISFMLLPTLSAIEPWTHNTAEKARGGIFKLKYTLFERKAFCYLKSLATAFELM